MRFMVQRTFMSLTLNDCISLQVEPLVFKTAITSTFPFRRQTNVCFQSYSERAAVFQRDLKQADRQKDCTQQSSLINNKEIPLCRCSLTHWGKLVCEKDVKQQWNETNPLLPPRLWWDTWDPGFVFELFSVPRPISLNLGYITPLNCTKLTLALRLQFLLL